MVEKKVKVYSTPTCPHCKAAKKYLGEKGVDFEDIDVSKDSEAAEEMFEKSKQQGVPVIDVGGKIIVGFDQDALDEALEKD